MIEALNVSGSNLGQNPATLERDAQQLRKALARLASNENSASPSPQQGVSTEGVHPEQPDVSSTHA